uniref:Uncharacterized protein n=1 Tax=Anguilla anguilla TaxID=7936 RepID=A0A0E9RFE3_ANGAN
MQFTPGIFNLFTQGEKNYDKNWLILNIGIRASLETSL